MKYIIGISAYYHDSAAALITDSGEIVCAVQEERFTRIKHDSSFPKQSVKFFLSEFNLDSKDIEAIIFY